MSLSPAASLAPLLPVLFWFEQEAGGRISPATDRIIHAAVKSAVMHNAGASVLVYSNTLPFEHFCWGNSSLRGWARRAALPYTCRASVQRYNLDELLRPHGVEL